MAKLPYRAMLPILRLTLCSPILMEKEHETRRGNHGQIQEADAPGIERRTNRRRGIREAR